MKKGRASDLCDITLEMIHHGSSLLHVVLLDIFNDMLIRGYLDPSWHNTVFQILPKSGDLKEPSNWRPIAILPVVYKIFSKMLCNRLRDVLLEHQPDDQYAFRPSRDINDVFFHYLGKCSWKKYGVWLATLVC